MERPGFKRLVQHYWTQIRKYSWSFFGVFALFGIAILIADLLVPQLYRTIIDLLSSGNDPQEIAPRLFKLLLYIALSMFTYNVLFRIADFLYTYSEVHIVRSLQNYAFAELSKHSYRFFTNAFAGSLVTKVRRFARSFERLFFVFTIRFWLITVQFTGVLIVLSFIAPTLALLFVIWVVIYVTITVMINLRKRPLDIAFAESYSRMTGVLADAITNIFNIKVFSARRPEIERYAKASREEQETHLREWNYANWMLVFQGFALAILEIVAMYIALRLWIDGQISTGTVVLVQIYIGVMWHNLWTLGHAIIDFNRAVADAVEMVEILDEPIEIKDVENPEQLQIKNGEIMMRHITFHYGDNDNNVFSDFSLTIPAGQRIGLVGHSGAGKSTVTKLLLRFADIQDGVIDIDGQDITKITQDDLRSQIAYVPQDPILFHRSLRDNIAYGRPDATDEEIADAAKKAHAHEFITGLPQGYDTLVGERGVKLSGGERQRVAIARAMLKKAPILILDEATSSLDAVSEKYIQEAFKELMKGRTTIVIAHRLSTIQKLDRIIVLEDGKIAEEGTHDQLLAKEGIYHNFWSHQTDGFIE